MLLTHFSNTPERNTELLLFSHRVFRAAALLAGALTLSISPVFAQSPAFTPSPTVSAPLTHAALHALHVRQQADKHAAAEKALSGSDVIATAYSLRGSRYRMGGTSRSGFDCSGFVRYILSHSGGVDIPRTATEQYYHGTPVSREAMLPGDLVFFKNTYKHGISHVGMYVGGGKFIHAANVRKGVRVDVLDSSYYAAHYAGARRVLSADRLVMARER